MQSEIDKDKHQSIATLKEGLAEKCADNLTEVLINLESGTCDYLELIPVLEEVARVEWFYYFDDNGAGGFPHADIRRKTSFKSWALTAIQNIRQNSRFESSSSIHNVLKSNNTTLIKTTLEQLKAEHRTVDKSLIPILEKIARKDVYEKYSYIGGFEKDCHLGELAKAIIQIITQHSDSMVTQDKPTSVTNEYPGRCSVCGSLPDDITVNTGREEYFPSAFSQLIGMDEDRGEFRTCPDCRTYFNWIDMPQMYGSGNNAEERLVRLPKEKSRLLDKLFTADSNYQPTSIEVEEYLGSLPLDMLVPAVGFHLHRNRELITAFVPHLVRLLGKNNDTSLWNLLNGYVSDNPERAEEILNAFRSSDEYASTRLTQILHHCMKLLNGK
jgi:hypothetical protein